MCRLEITYRTDNTLDDFIGIDHEIEQQVGKHGGIIDGRGMGPEGRELVVDIFPDTELKRVVSALSSYRTMTTKIKYFSVNRLD